jgi:hypothetical protein
MEVLAKFMPTSGPTPNSIWATAWVVKATQNTRATQAVINAFFMMIPLNC